MVLLGQKIKTLRNEHHLTQTELAAKVGVTKSTVAAYENDSRMPSYDILIKMSKIFHVTTDSLLLDTAEKILYVDRLTREQVGIIDTLIESFRITNMYKESGEEALDGSFLKAADEGTKYKARSDMNSKRGYKQTKKH